jgi:hypothetical protein
MAVINQVPQSPWDGINQEDAIPRHSGNHKGKINKATYLSSHLEEMEKLKNVI